jgi:hypothetical protein
MEKYRSQEPAWAKDREALGRFLWWDPDQQPLDPATLPTTRLFPTSGHVTMRSNWSEHATFATFRCGRFGEIDGGWGRNNADNLSFTIRKHGPLAIDSGPVHGQNTTVLKFLGQGSDSGVPAIGNYGRQTIAHNSITVGDGEYQHRDWQGKPTADVVRRGGQSVPQARDWWRVWGFPGPQADFQEGRITAYRTHPLYDYACGDARFSYPPDWGVEEITRQFLYLKPNVFVIYDRLTLADPEQRPCWMQHSLREPRATGVEQALTAAEIGPQFLWNGREQIPHPSPGGHVWMGGDGFAIESGSPGKPGGGWLSVRTLLPAEDECLRKKIGGQGHDFEVAGVQYGVADEGYRLADDPYAVRSTIGLLGWRVELRPKTAAKTIEFLHVLQVGAAGRSPDAVRGVTQRLTAETSTLTIPQGSRRFVLTLNRTGKRGGTIVAEDSRTAIRESLPEDIEDHWRYFKDDPHSHLWETDPRYRVLLGSNQVVNRSGESRSSRWGRQGKPDRKGLKKHPLSFREPAFPGDHLGAWNRFRLSYSDKSGLVAADSATCKGRCIKIIASCEQKEGGWKRGDDGDPALFSPRSGRRPLLSVADASALPYGSCPDWRQGEGGYKVLQ